MLMSTANQNHVGYSADVRMHLSVGGRVFPIAQLGPDFIILDKPLDQPPASGEIVLLIDGSIRLWPVHLPDGISAGQSETRITDCR
jgi:hypothetical protein